MDKAKILIVEDEKIIAKDMESTLKNRGYIIQAIVGTGEEAIKKVEETQPDLVLMDIVLKGKMDGIDSARRIHKDFDIPVIFITAFTNDNMLQRAKAAEPYAYIVKPFESSELYTNIEVALYKHSVNKRLQALASFPEQSPNPIIEINLNGEITYLNEAARSQFPYIGGLTEEHPITKDLESVVVRLQGSGDGSVCREVNVGDQVYEEKICYMRDGGLIRIFVFEITERKRTEKKLRDLSLVDQLTGLYNRRGFFTLVEQQISLANRTKRGFYLLFADLDKMKWINDTFGHHEGDLVLKTIALLCKKSFRKSDIIGRLGGDEFAVCAIEAQRKSAQMLIRRLKQNLYEYNKRHESDFDLSLSIGTTYYDPNQACTIEELLIRADKLMYEHKMSKHGPQIIETLLKRPESPEQYETDHYIKSNVITLLMIEDNPDDYNLFRKTVKQIKTPTFKTIRAADLQTGLRYLYHKHIDLVILDLNLPDSKGLDTLKQLHTKGFEVPIIVLTAHEEEDLAIKVIREGAQDCFIKGRINKEILVRSMKYAIERKYAELELKSSFGKFLKVLEETITAMAGIVEMRDPYTAGHQKRVSQLAQAIAKEMNLTEEQTKGITMAALIHDVGKTQVPEDILNKATKLSKKEMKIVKTHSGTGYEILKTIKFPWLITQIVHQHHERLNGSGYPMGIAGKDILLESKILAVADVVEAMTSHRPYRPAPGIEKALKEIKQHRGKLYDADVVGTCIKLFKNKKFKFKKQ